MKRLRRYWTLWRTLPADERRMRAGRMVERLLRQRTSIRRLGLAPDTPRPGRFRRALRVPPSALAPALRECRPDRGPLFGDLAPRAATVATNAGAHVRAVLDTASRILAGVYDLLGSGPARLGRSDGGLDWHTDWRADRSWPADRFHTDLVTVRGDGSDVKLPWELSRCQHLLVLGQAYLLAPHALAGDEAERLRTRCATAAREQIDDWTHSNPRGLGVNWTCTMEVAIRAANWLAVLGLMRTAPELDDAFLWRTARALWIHGRYIRRHLEIGSDGLTSNHFLADVTGLYSLACALPELRESDEWRTLAARALEEEIVRQVHADGVDFEHSLPYHRLVTEMFLHAALIARGRGTAFSTAFHVRLALMLEFTACATRGDHTVAQWGDNDDGRWMPLDGYASDSPHDHRHLLMLGGRFLGRDDLVAAGAGAESEATWLLGGAEPDRAAPPAGRASRGFPDAGLYVMRAGDLHCAIACSPVGTRGVGNHSHNDALSVCVWASGVEWISDPGTGCYTGDPELRNRMRSTAAHATLQLGHREQNELGAGLDGLFQMGDRARPEVTLWESDGRRARLVAHHHGFDSGTERWRHERAVDFDGASRTWLIRDRLVRESGHGAPHEPIYLRFPLRPGTRWECTADLPAELERLCAARLPERARDGSRRLVCLRLTAGGPAVLWIGLDLPAGSEVGAADGLYSPRYGVTRPAAIITATLPAAARSSTDSLLWSPGEA